MHKQHRKFSEKAKVGARSQGTLPPASFTHTSNISSPTWTLRALRLLRSPTPAAPTSPSQSRLGDCLSCSKGNKRPPAEEGVRVSACEGKRVEAERPFACLLHPTACGARLLQLSRNAFHPSHIHL